jgi:histone deacetylase 11
MCSCHTAFWGLEKLHPFDAGKFRRIVTWLKRSKTLSEAKIVRPKPATRQHLLLIHTPEYLDSLESPAQLAEIAQFPPLALLPAWLARRQFTEPNRLHVGGSILAGKLALQCGWAVNIGGGMHHASASSGGGWCVYSDTVLSYQHLRLAYPEAVKRILIIDCDVHQVRLCLQYSAACHVTHSSDTAC